MTETTAITGEIAAANAAFEEAFGRGDAAALADLYAAGAQLLPTNSDVVEGRDAIRAFWQSVMDTGIDGGELVSVEVEGFGNDAYEVGRYSLTSGGKIADEGKYIVLWKREGDRWKLFRDIWNTSRPAS